MAWSPLLQHNLAHRWIRQLITQTARDLGPDGMEKVTSAKKPAKKPKAAKAKTVRKRATQP
jgi:hypothetical protein